MPPFPVITIRVGDGARPPWGNRGGNRGLKIPPDSFHAWVRLGTWEFGMGVLLCVIFGFGTQLIASAPHSIVTVFDVTNC